LATGAINLEDRKARGAHYTPEPLARFVARLIRGAMSVSDVGRPVRLLDPAIGDGSLVSAILDDFAKHDFPVSEVVGFDTSPDAIAESRAVISKFHPDVSLSLRVSDFLLSPESSTNELTLFSTEERAKFDVVIANPPYVRTQVLGAVESQRLAATFALSGRVDLYFAFLVGIARSLRVGGVAGIIVSNRFMTTRSGAPIRQFLRESFDILEVYDLGDTRIFEAAVLPAILVLRKRGGLPQVRPASFTTVYSAPNQNAEKVADDIISALDHSGFVALPSGDTFRVQHGALASNNGLTDVWRLSSSDNDAWLAQVARHTAKKFGDLGRIRVGIKTTADKVFIRDDWDSLPPDQSPETLRPLITHHVGRRFAAGSASKPKKVLYTHCVEEGKRRAIPLEEFPNAARYLEQHRRVLEARSYVIEAGRAWYEIWVPHDPDLWTLPKLVFRDISVRPEFWIDHSGSVVNGDCYWLAGASLDDLYLALAVANSTFIESFYDRNFNNKLYAGRRRFITQYVEHFPLPDSSTSSARRLIELTKERCVARDELHHALEAQLDALVWTAFGLVSEEATR
jgi:hypothetical protein